ncbi:MAG: DUF3500 domain-containing protein [Phycisphaera sp.]|nr:DUF3500 domain-containing protein [Phycisphaera sp.]
MSNPHRPARNAHRRDLIDSLTRRDILRSGAALGAVAAGLPLVTAPLVRAAAPAGPPETLVKQFYDSLSDAQKKVICFKWDHTEEKRGLLRTRISNNWHITQPAIYSDFYTKDQHEMSRAIFEGIIQPDWHSRIDKQLQDDAGGFGKSQNIAIFGEPGAGKFELVMTGRHMTLRCDGDSAEHVAFGGPIFYGHAASGFHEKVGHPGNVFWPQAQEANKLYQMLDGKQREQALVIHGLPDEAFVDFRGKDGKFQGIAIKDLTADQKEHAQTVLSKLIEPYRQNDRDEAIRCLNAQGGLDACHLAFYDEGDIGDDKIWDCWRLEGPSFVWHYRGSPHVHVWVNVADSADVELNA